jgi:hypothetical protein
MLLACAAKVRLHFFIHLLFSYHLVPLVPQCQLAANLSSISLVLRAKHLSFLDSTLNLCLRFAYPSEATTIAVQYDMVPLNRFRITYTCYCRINSKTQQWKYSKYYKCLLWSGEN